MDGKLERLDISEAVVNPGGPPQVKWKVAKNTKVKSKPLRMGKPLSPYRDLCQYFVINQPCLPDKTGNRKEGWGFESF